MLLGELRWILPGWNLVCCQRRALPELFWSVVHRLDNVVTNWKPPHANAHPTANLDANSIPGDAIANASAYGSADTADVSPDSYRRAPLSSSNGDDAVSNSSGRNWKRPMLFLGWLRWRILPGWHLVCSQRGALRELLWGVVHRLSNVITN
jgi:hypothetical protein